MARLDTRQQAIIMGHAVPMPVVVRTRAYDDDSYNAVMKSAAAWVAVGVGHQPTSSHRLTLAFTGAMLHYNNIA